MFESKGLGCRKHIRARTKLLMEINSPAHARKVLAEDVSFGGMFLTTPTHGISIGEILSIIILHPTSKRKFVTDAEVMHIRQGQIPLHSEYEEGLGVQFINLTPARKRDIASFLKSILFSNRKFAA